MARSERRFEHCSARHAGHPSARAVSRMRCLGSAVPGVLLAVVITLIGLSVPGVEQFHEQLRAGGGPVLAAEARATHGESYAESADPAVSAAAVRGQGEVVGERHAPPVSAQGASSGFEADPLWPAQPPAEEGDPPVSEDPAHRHGVRAPPSPSGN
ncbi:hypothetical protein ACIQJT_33670 [Streptomyces sp. NPDC091972]|uniref:hypothetical protein n=1 Tax=Streptomyces sp. NPDC091972 TaxID=3366007 RepID=UPI0037FDD3A2